jgi:hypothetical protein
MTEIFHLRKNKIKLEADYWHSQRYPRKMISIYSKKPFPQTSDCSSTCGSQEDIYSKIACSKSLSLDYWVLRCEWHQLSKKAGICLDLILNKHSVWSGSHSVLPWSGTASNLSWQSHLFPQTHQQDSSMWADRRLCSPEFEAVETNTIHALLKAYKIEMKQGVMMHT